MKQRLYQIELNRLFNVLLTALALFLALLVFKKMETFEMSLRNSWQTHHESQNSVSRKSYFVHHPLFRN